MDNTVNTSAAATAPAVALGANEVPTPEEIDNFADRWFKAKAIYAAAHADLANVEKEGIDLVKKFGTVPPNAENSRQLASARNQLRVTVGNNVSILEDRVQDVKAALEARNLGHLFPNIFTERIRHEQTREAEKAILAAAMPKRFTEKILGMFKRCFDVKKKAPSLNVKRIVEKPAKRSKAKKATAAASEVA
jgi:hypothetical protein